MRISDWSSDVCSSDLADRARQGRELYPAAGQGRSDAVRHRGDPGRWPGHLRRRCGDAVLDSEIGRASCRERVCQYVEISVVAGSLKKKQSAIHNKECTKST